MKRVKVGIIGCGNISTIYIKNLQLFKALELVAVSDIDLKRAEARAAEFGVPRACSPEKLLKDKEIGIVINLTVPKVHMEVAMKAIKAG